MFRIIFSLPSLIFFMVSFLMGQNLVAKDAPIVAVGEASLEKDQLGIIPYYPKTGRTLAKAFHLVLVKDFSFYRKRFTIVKPKKSHKARYLIEVTYSNNRYDATLQETNSNIILLSANGNFKKSNLRLKAHTLADHFYQKITDKESIFLSKIIFVSDRHSRHSTPIKELYIMDFDGKNPKRLTTHRGIVISPAFSPNGKKVIYSLIHNTAKEKNVNLWMLNIKNRRSKIISQRPGINSGAIFTPDGEHIILTLAHQGNAELYQMNLKTKKLRRLTKDFAPDVDPSLNLKGDKLVFLSGRPGDPMVYMMDPSGLERDVERISFVGKFNATPRFNPNGTQIAFASWLDNRFDIFRLNADKTNLSRLTKDFGSNEDPTYSNDGQFIAFSSQRVISRKKATHNIYIMTSEGEIIGNITQKSKGTPDLGNCITPRWSR